MICLLSLIFISGRTHANEKPMGASTTWNRSYVLTSHNNLHSDTERLESAAPGVSVVQSKANTGRNSPNRHVLVITASSSEELGFRIKRMLQVINDIAHEKAIYSRGESYRIGLSSKKVPFEVVDIKSSWVFAVAEVPVDDVVASKNIEELQLAISRTLKKYAVAHHEALNKYANIEPDGRIQLVNSSSSIITETNHRKKNTSGSKALLKQVTRVLRSARKRLPGLQSRISISRRRKVK